MDLCAQLHLLRKTTSNERTHIQALAEAVTEMGRALEASFGDRGAEFSRIVDQFVTAYNDNASNLGAHALFSGYGPLAQRIRDAVVTQSIVFRGLPTELEQHHTSVLAQFDFQPSMDETQLKPLRDFFSELYRRVKDPAVRPQCLVRTGLMSDLKTGYFTPDVSKLERSQTCLGLAATLGDTGVRVAVYTDATFTLARPVQYSLYHPLEDRWVEVPHNVVLPGVLEALQAELAQAEVALARTPVPASWTAEWESLGQRIEVLFETAATWLPMDVGCYHRTWKQQHLYLRVGSYTVEHTQTGGEYPTYVRSITQGAASERQPISTFVFEKLAEAIQERIVHTLRQSVEQLEALRPAPKTQWAFPFSTYKFALPTA